VTFWQRPRNAQNSALQWYALDSRIKERHNVQRFILATLFFSTGGYGWIRSQNFLSSINECFWEGITCEGGGNNNIAKIALANNNLTNSLPSELGKLPYLRELIIDGNSLTGTLCYKDSLDLNVNLTQDCKEPNCNC